MPTFASVGQDGEYSGFDGEVQLVLIPNEGLPGEPSQSPGQVPISHSGGGSSGTSSSSPNIRRIFVGNDAYGNPVYQYLADPVPRYYYDYQVGWNARAYVPQLVGSAGVFSFMAGAAIGAVVGLTRLPNVTAGYNDIEAGFLIERGVASIVAFGTVLYTIPVATLSEDPGKYNPATDHLEIRKFFNRVEFYITGGSQGASGTSLIYILNTTLQEGYFSAGLYVGGDVINDERFWVPDYGVGTVGVVAGGRDDSFTDGYGAARIGIESSGTEMFYADGVAQLSVKAFGGDSLRGGGQGYIGPIRGSGMTVDSGEIVIDYSFGIGYVGPVIGYGVGHDIDVGEGSGEIGPVRSFGTDILNYGAGQSSMRVRARGAEMVNINEATFMSFGYGWHGFGGQVEGFIVFDEKMQIVGVFTAEVIESLMFESGFNGTDTFTHDEIVTALLSSFMSASDAATFKQDGMTVWALHMDAMGSTRYEGYDFNSFMSIDGVDYGVNSTGIHRLEGATDGGTAIQATVDFGKLNFGSNNRKSLPYVYVGMAASGKTVLKIESDGQTYLYTVRDSTESMKTHRFEPGRGLRGNFYGVSLVSNGKAFDLHNIEFQQIELKRRL